VGHARGKLVMWQLGYSVLN